MAIRRSYLGTRGRPSASYRMNPPSSSSSSGLLKTLFTDSFFNSSRARPSLPNCTSRAFHIGSAHRTFHIPPHRTVTASFPKPRMPYNPFNLSFRSMSSPPSSLGSFPSLAVAGICAGIFGIVVLWEHFDRHTCTCPEGAQAALKLSSSQIKSKESEISELKKSAEETKLAITKKDQVLVALKEEIEKAEKVVKTVRTENTGLTQQVQKLAQELGDARKTTEKGADDLQNDLSKLRKHLHQVETQLRSSRAQCANLESEKEAQKARVKMLEELLESTRAEIKADHAKAKEQMKEHVEEKEKEVESSRKEVEKKNKEIQKLEKALHVAKVQAQAHSHHHSQSHSSHQPAASTAALEAKLQTQTAKVDELKSELASLTSTYETSNKRLISELELSQVEITRQSDLVTSLHQNLERALADVQAKSHIASGLERDLANLKEQDEATNRRLVSELESSQLEAQRQINLVASLRQDLEHAISDARAKSQVAVELEHQLAQASKDEAANRRLTAELDASQLEVVRQSGLITSLRQNLEQALMDVQAKASIASGLEKELAILTKTEASEHSELESSHLELARQSGTITTLRHDLEHALADAQIKSKLASALEKEVARLRKEEEANRRLVSELESSHAEVARQSGLIKALRHDLGKAQSDVHAKSQTMTKLEKELATLRKEEADVKHHLSSELKASQLAVTHQSDLIASLEQNLNTARSDFHAKSRVASDLEKKLGELKKHEAESERRFSAELDASKHEIKRQAELVASLRRDLDRALSDVHTKSEIASGLEKEILVLNEREEKSSQRFASELATSQLEITRQSDLITSLRHKLEHALSDAHAKSLVASSLQKELAELRREVEGYEQKLANVSEMYRLLEEEMKKVGEEARVNAHEAKVKARELEKKAKEVVELIRVREEKEAALGETLLELEGAQRVLSERDAEFWVLREKVGEVQVESASRLDEVKALTLVIEGLNKQISRLEGVVEVKTSEERSLIEMVEMRTTELENAQRELGDRDAAIAVLQDEEAILQAECERKGKAVEGAEKDVAAFKSLVERLKREVRELEGKLETKTKEVEVKTKEMRNVEERKDAKLKEVYGEVEWLQGEAITLKETFDGYKIEMRETIARKDVEATLLRGELEEWKKQVESVSVTLTLRTFELEESGKSLDLAKGEIEHLRLAVKKDNEDVGHLQLEIVDLKSTCEKLRVEREEFERLKKQSEEEYTVAVGELRNTNEELGAKVVVMKEQAKIQESDLEDLRRAREQERARLVEDAERLSRELAEAKEKVILLERSSAQMKVTMESHEQELNSLKASAGQRGHEHEKGNGHDHHHSLFSHLRGHQGDSVFSHILHRHGHEHGEHHHENGHEHELAIKLKELERQKNEVDREVEKKIKEVESRDVEVETIKKLLASLKAEVKTKDGVIERLENELKKSKDKPVPDTDAASVKSTSSSYTRVQASVASLGSASASGDNASESASGRLRPEGSLHRRRVSSIFGSRSDSSEGSERPISQLFDGVKAKGSPLGPKTSVKAKKTIPQRISSFIERTFEHDEHEHGERDKGNGHEHGKDHGHEKEKEKEKKEQKGEKEKREKNAGWKQENLLVGNERWFNDQL